MTALTDQLVKRLQQPTKGATRHWDSYLNGFHVEIRTSGTRTYRYRYRDTSGRQRTVTVGRASELSTSQARKLARDLAARVRLGESPADDRAKARTEAKVRLRDIAAQALGPDSDLKTATRHKYQSQWERFLKPSLGHRPVASIERTEVARVLDAVPGTVQRNRVRALLSRLMAHAVRRGHIDHNPVRAVEKGREHSREGFLGTEQLRTVWASCEAEEADPLGAAAIQLVLLTGCRKGEALAARWADFDLEAGIWSKSPGYTKSRKRHTVYLDGAALDLLMGLCERAQGAYLFPSPCDSSRPRHDIRRIWDRIRRRSGLEVGWRIHDLRHSFASMLAAQGVPATAIQQLLGHSSLAVTQRYMHAHEDALRRAVEENGMGNVVDLSKYREAS